MDIRSQKTREAIFAAFFELLGSQNFHQLSVGQLIEKARIGRSTFYSHFTSKDDLLMAVCQQLFEHVFETSSYQEHIHGARPSQPDDLLDLLTHLFAHFKDNEAKVRTLFKLDDDYFNRSFHAQLKTYLVPLVLPHYFADSKLPPSLLQAHISETFLTTLNWWLAQQDPVTARAVSFYYLQLLA